MKTEQRKRIIIVTACILLGIVILLAGVFIMGKQRKTFEKTITIRAIFNDVNGLMVGHNVWISGVKVGTVKRVKLYSDSEVEVTMNIEQRSQGFIRKDAKAKIGSDGLIGNRIVIIYGGTPQAAIVQDGAALTVEKAISNEEMLNTLQDNNKSLAAITSDFKIVSKRLAEGHGSLGKLLTDETLINDLQSTVATLKLASMNTKMLTANLADYSSRLHVKGSLAGDLVSDTSIFNMVRETVFQIKEVSKTANDIVGNFKNVSDRLNNVSNKVDSSNGAISTLMYDKEVASNLKGTLRNLEAGTEKLDENMEALQHNFLFRGYFRKKALNDAKKTNRNSVSKL